MNALKNKKINKEKQLNKNLSYLTNKMTGIY